MDPDIKMGIKVIPLKAIHYFIGIDFSVWERLVFSRFVKMVFQRIISMPPVVEFQYDFCHICIIPHKLVVKGS